MGFSFIAHASACTGLPDSYLQRVDLQKNQVTYLKYYHTVFGQNLSTLWKANKNLWLTDVPVCMVDARSDGQRHNEVHTFDQDKIKTWEVGSPSQGEIQAPHLVYVSSIVSFGFRNRQAFWSLWWNNVQNGLGKILQGSPVQMNLYHILMCISAYLMTLPNWWKNVNMTYRRRFSISFFDQPHGGEHFTFVNILTIFGVIMFALCVQSKTSHIGCRWKGHQWWELMCPKLPSRILLVQATLPQSHKDKEQVSYKEFTVSHEYIPVHLLMFV